MLKKITFSALLMLLTFTVKAQLTASDNAPFYTFSVSKDNYTIHIYIFNGIENTTEFDAGTDAAVWYNMDNMSTPISSGTRKLYQPDDASGYVLDVNGTKTYVWVFDYNKYIPSVASFKAESDPKNQCTGLNLMLDANIPDMVYKSPVGLSYKLDRIFTLTYNSEEWSSGKWNSVVRTSQVKLPQTMINMGEAPLCDTHYILEDEFAKQLQIDKKYTSDLYSAVAVQCHITTEAVTRNEKNEGERPSQISATSGSAPLELFFKSNGNVPVPLYYNWVISKGGEVITQRNDVDQRFTFVENGNYKVKLTVSDDYCSYSDSMTVTISESAIKVPNVFSPDGNGQNDEFRVGYKSLVSFQCWVYNRWGRQVYYWDNPQKGWDGTINGTPASTGPYFYVINAKGSDGKVYHLKGDINLLREKP